MLNDSTQCPGCINIAQESFPFASGETKEHSINTEGCGIFDLDDYSHLEIFFCPVCGIKLDKA